ncbi:hypothetical protein P7K49_010432, partial [Saguinus oedipus]
MQTQGPDPAVASKSGLTAGEGLELVPSPIQVAAGYPVPTTAPWARAKKEEKEGGNWHSAPPSRLHST